MKKALILICLSMIGVLIYLLFTAEILLLGSHYVVNMEFVLGIWFVLLVFIALVTAMLYKSLGRLERLEKKISLEVSKPPEIPTTLSAAPQPTFCKHCGAKLVPAATFCSNCGQKVR